MSFDRLTENVKRFTKKGVVAVMDTKKMGKRIREARMAKGFSQEDLGDALNLTRSSVSLWEKGRSVPEDHNLRGLASLLNVSVGYITKGEGKAPPKSEIPESGYRRDMMGRMQRLIETGMFNHLIIEQLDRMIDSGEMTERLAKRGYVWDERQAKAWLRAHKR